MTPEEKRSIREQRIDQLLSSVPDIFNYNTLLYIGAKVKKRWPAGMTFMDRFLEAKYTIDVLEPWPQNADNLVRFNLKGKEFVNAKIGPGTFRYVIKGMVEEVDKIEYLKSRIYDVVFFWHGPEHVEISQVEPILKKLEKLTRMILVLGSPFGIYRQKNVGGNPFEIHQSAIYPEFYSQIGYEWSTLGERDVKKSNLMGWKRFHD